MRTPARAREDRFSPVRPILTYFAEAGVFRSAAHDRRAFVAVQTIVHVRPSADSQTASGLVWSQCLSRLFSMKMRAIVSGLARATTTYGLRCDWVQNAKPS